MLNEAQKKIFTEIWNHYAGQLGSTTNSTGIENPVILDAARQELIPELQKLLADYLAGRILLAAMKTANDSANKSHQYWGFKGMNGQMFFNMLYNVSEEQKRMDVLDKTLKSSLSVPKNIGEAKDKINALVKLSNELGERCANKRQAPRTGSSLFFITYFWQVQASDKWPIYYNSMVKVLMDESLWSPSNDYAVDYESFCGLNADIQRYLADRTKKPIALWDIEHALWAWGEEDEVGDTDTPVKDKMPDSLPSSYVPPVISILSHLAKNDPAMIAACEKAGVSVEKTFEDRLGILFQMMGFHVEFLGQGKGREPDGIASSREFGYAIVYDAKVRQGGYVVGTDDRAIREYIGRHTERLRKTGIRNVYFAVISSGFAGDFDDVIRTLKIETDVREILFIETSSLVTFLDHKLRNPDVDLGNQGLQGILVNSGVVTDADMRGHLGI